MVLVENNGVSGAAVLCNRESAVSGSFRQTYLPGPLSLSLLHHTLDSKVKHPTCIRVEVIPAHAAENNVISAVDP